MTGNFKVYFSNRVEALFDCLKTGLYANPACAFTRRLIAVPSPAMKSWISQELAREQGLGVAMGLEFGYLDEVIKKLSGLVSASSPMAFRMSAVTPLELTFALADIIRKLIQDCSQLSGQEARALAPLLAYLKAGENSQGAARDDRRLSMRIEKRLISLSSKLADLFGKYGIYGQGMLRDWEEGRVEGWQPLLWNALLRRYPEFAFPRQELAEAIKGLSPSVLGDMQLHLFSMSFIPKSMHHFLSLAAECIPVNYYILSPCQLFWSDIRSDRESKQLRAMWRSKGASEDQLEQLEDFLNERNPLLANFGRLGREMVQAVEESPALTFDAYILPKSVKEHPAYQPLLLPDTAYEESLPDVSMLESVQADILTLRALDPSGKVSIPPEDHSIEVHAHAAKKREIEGLYDRLLGIMRRHADDSEPIAPGSIIVMAPDIMEYIPSIQCVFGSADSVLDFQIMDMPMPAQSSFIQCWLHLLNLAGGRWEADQLFALFEYSAFQKRHGIGKEELGQIKKWILEAGIRWGSSQDHRNKIMQKDHAGSKMAAESAAGTWDFGLERILLGLAMEDPGLQKMEEDSWEAVPVQNVEPVQASLLGRWIHLLRSLKEDLKILEGGANLTMKEWSCYLLCLARSYLDAPASDPESREAQEVLEDKIRALGKVSGVLENAAYPFCMVKQVHEDALSAHTVCYKENHLSAVRFCSMLPMRTLPAKVVALVGMQEGAYPRPAVSDSMNELTASAKADYCPSGLDFDRYLFLEALLSARQYFLLSYTRLSQDDNKEQPPSTLVQELLSYLDQAYLIGSDPVSRRRVYKHPYHPFDQRYFSGEKELFSFSKANYRRAEAFYHSHKKPAHCFIPGFSFEDVPNDPGVQEVNVDLKDLGAFTKNPFKTYFNKTLGIYIDDPEKEMISSLDTFELNTLEKYNLFKDGLKHSFESVIEKAAKEGLLPSGVFGDVARAKLRTEHEERLQILSGYGADPESIHSIRLSDLYEKPELSDGEWLFPPLRVESAKGVRVKLTGYAGEVIPQGYLIYGSEENDLYKYWGPYLVFLTLARQHGLPCQPDILCNKKAAKICVEVSDPAEALGEFLDYYFLGMRSISPFDPKLTAAILSQEGGSISEKISKAFFGYQESHNHYANWLFRHRAALSSLSCPAEDWRQLGIRIFAPVVNATQKKKGLKEKSG